jgi:uncharacterized membrane protein
LEPARYFEEEVGEKIDETVESVKKSIDSSTPGTWALFILIRKATLDKVLEGLSPYQGRVIQTSLSHKDENALRKVFEEANRISVSANQPY